MPREALNGDLVSLAQNVGPRKEARDFGRRKIQEAVEAIKSDIREHKRKFTVARFKIVGGDEQKTSCWAKMDFDCVLFVNDGRPWMKSEPNVEGCLEKIRNEVVNEWKEFFPRVLGNMGINVQFSDNKKRAILDWKEGFSADFLVGVNACNPHARAIHNDSGSECSQVENMHKVLLNLPTEEKRQQVASSMTFSVSVTECGVDLIRSMPGDQIELARLAKFWALIRCTNPAKARSQSLMVTLIALNSYQPRTSLVDNFQNFLKKLEIRDFNIDNSVEMSTFDMKGIQKVRKIIAPGNIYDDLLTSCRSQKDQTNINLFLDVCREAALATLRILDQYKNFNGWKYVARVFLDEDTLKHHGLKRFASRCTFYKPRQAEEEILYPKVKIHNNRDPDDMEKLLLRLVGCAASFIPRNSVDGRLRSFQEVSEDLEVILREYFKLDLKSGQVPYHGVEMQLPLVNGLIIPYTV